MVPLGDQKCFHSHFAGMALKASKTVFWGLLTLRVSSKKFLFSAWRDCVFNAVREEAHSGNIPCCGAANGWVPRDQCGYWSSVLQRYNNFPLAMPLPWGLWGNWVLGTDLTRDETVSVLLLSVPFQTAQMCHGLIFIIIRKDSAAFTAGILQEWALWRNNSRDFKLPRGEERTFN